MPDDAAEWLRHHPQPGDQAETTDRLFLLRYHDEQALPPAETRRRRLTHRARNRRHLVPAAR